jgi:hypothetical protein
MPAMGRRTTAGTDCSCDGGDRDRKTLARARPATRTTGLAPAHGRRIAHICERIEHRTAGANCPALSHARRFCSPRAADSLSSDAWSDQVVEIGVDVLSQTPPRFQPITSGRLDSMVIGEVRHRRQIFMAVG